MKTILSNVKYYAETRNRVIDEVINLTKIVYPRDREMLSGVINLTSSLMIADPNQEFIDGLRGFILYASMSDKVTSSSLLTTLIHDLGEFSRNRHEPWFSPRTNGYVKYLSGASNTQVI